MVLARYISSIVLGIASAIATWALVLDTHPMFVSVSFAGLVPGIVAGLVGGFVAGWLAPRRKLIVPMLLGFLSAAFLLGSIFSRGSIRGDHNPFLWYWPMWLLPAFAIGGYLSRNLWLPPNTSLERTREG